MPRTKRLSCGLVTVTGLLCLSGPAPASDYKVIRTIAPTQRIDEWLAAGAYEEAAAYLNERLRRRPNDPALLYRAAQVESRLHRPDEAAAHLMAALKAGYRDFSDIRRDSDLAAIRDHDIFRAIVDARDAADPLLSDRNVALWRERLGEDSYELRDDPSRRLRWLAPAPFRDMPTIRRMNRLYDELEERLFSEPQEHQVLVMLVDPADRARALDRTGVGGVYRHEARELIALDVEVSLPHELCHLLHHSHMDRLGQEHAFWLQEGLASLFESWESLTDGGWYFIPTNRQLLAQRLSKRGELLPLAEFLAIDHEQFTRDAARSYAQARTFMRFVDERVGAAALYRAYVARFEGDPTGRLALEAVFEESLGSIEESWRQWLDAQPIRVHGAAHVP